MARHDAGEGLDVRVDEGMVVGQVTGGEHTWTNLTEIGERVLVIRTEGSGGCGGLVSGGPSTDERLVTGRGKRVVGVCVRESAPAIVGEAKCKVIVHGREERHGALSSPERTCSRMR